jgi:hypothetical protein
MRFRLPLDVPRYLCAWAQMPGHAEIKSGGGAAPLSAERERALEPK